MKGLDNHFRDSGFGDKSVSAEISRMPNVIEVYPQIRFFTEVRYDSKPFATMVAGMPESSKASGAFDGMQGSFFSSPNADEAILQAEFAKELNPQTASLIGKDLILRYAERQALPSQAQAGDPAEYPGGFSVVPREKHLRIIGVVETEPASGFGGFGSGRLLIPLPLAETLRAAQVNDLRDILRDTSGDKPTYSSLTVRVKSPSLVEATEAKLKDLKMRKGSIAARAEQARGGGGSEGLGARGGSNAFDEFRQSSAVSLWPSPRSASSTRSSWPSSSVVVKSAF